MRCEMTDLRPQNPSGTVRRNRRALRGLSTLLAVACCLTLGSAGADEPTTTKTKPAGSAPAQRATTHGESEAFPECLEKLKLSVQQHEQIKQVIRGYDESFEIVWKQFGDRYFQTIATEASMLAAIEDNLTEAQRQQVRAQRHKTAKYEKATASTNLKANQSATKENKNPADPTNAADEGIAASGVNLTDEQEAVADKIQDKYRAQLRSLNRDIQGLHSRLLSLEADKLVEIEKVLTKEQLAELRVMRQNGPDAPAVAVRATRLNTKE